MKEKFKIITVGLVVAMAILGGVCCYTFLEWKKEPVKVKEGSEEKEPSTKPVIDDNDKLDEKDDEKKESIVEPSDEEEIPLVPVIKPSSGSSSKPSLVVKPDDIVSNKPNIPEMPNGSEEFNKPENPEKPGDTVKPEEPSDPTIPSESLVPEKIEDLFITNEMLSEGSLKIENKKYGKVTISSNIEDNSKIELANLVINDSLILEKPGKYQLNIIDTNISNLVVKDEKKVFSLFRTMAYRMMNKALDGATINLVGDSRIKTAVINSNVHINGDNEVSEININNTSEVVLNIPIDELTLNTEGVVAVNKKVDNLVNNKKITMVINASVVNLTNNSESIIRVNNGEVVTNFNNYGSNTVVSGTGVITNALVLADNTRIYTNVINVPEIQDDVNSLLVRQELETEIIDVYSNGQGTVVFTLSKEINLTISDLAVICNAGKSIELFNLTTNDNKTYTLTTSYFKNDSYSLYITLPNGNIISKDFSTDYANPTVNKVKVERISDSSAILELYGVDEGGYLYYVIEDMMAREVMLESDIKSEGSVSNLKVGYNVVQIDGLDPGKMYNLYYVMEGFYGNITKVQGPLVIDADAKKEESESIKIVYAKEETINRFVFTLSEIPDKEITLADFEIECPSESNLTLNSATFYVSPDRLTYVIVVPDNYGHGDNKYTVRINVGNNEKIEGTFVSHFNPPVITGTNVKRLDEVTAQLTFNSDEAGEVYYGVYEWNGGIYDYNSTTPFANDVITGKVNSKKQELYAGGNTITIDLEGITVTNNTRIWALFVDEAGNYRRGFVDHYKVPLNIDKPEPKPDTTLDIINFNYTAKRFVIEFNEEIMYNVTTSDVDLSVVSLGSLPAKLLYIINNDEEQKVTIDIANYELPAGIYELTLNVVDKLGKDVKFVKQVEIK